MSRELALLLFKIFASIGIISFILSLYLTETKYEPLRRVTVTMSVLSVCAILLVLIWAP